jgi:hypothetical protein
MGILNFLKPRAYRDPELGDLVRKGGYWRGRISLGSQRDVPLLLAGARSAPDAASLGLVRELGSRYPTLRPAIEGALFEHYEPYLQALESGETEPLGDIPRLAAPEQVWRHVALVRVLIEPLGGVDTVEIAYRTESDEEHTLGARFQGWALTELNGSVI